MIRLAAIYDGDPQPRIHRALYPTSTRLQAIAICDLSGEKDTGAKQEVQRLRDFFNCELYDTPHDMFRKGDEIDGVLIDVGANAQLLFDIISQALQARINVLLPQPSSFNQLPLEKAVALGALAESHKVTLLAASRLIFGQCAKDINQHRRQILFGDISDCLIRASYGPVPDIYSLLSYAAGHPFQLLFHLLFPHPHPQQCELPETVTAIANNSPNQPPALALTLQFGAGTIACLLITASRSWGKPYHTIEISGSGGCSVESDLQTWKLITPRRGILNSCVNDDDEASEIYGSARKLEYFKRSCQLQSDTEDTLKNAVLPSLWLKNVVADLLNEKKISTTTAAIKRAQRKVLRTLNTQEPSSDEALNAYAKMGDWDAAFELARGIIHK